MAKSVSFKNGATAPSTTEEGYQANVHNGKGYFDLIVNVNANGKAIRISDKYGDNRVHITMNEVDALIAALKHVKVKNVKTSAEQITFADAA